MNLTFVVDLTVAINIGLADHLVDLLVRQLLAQIRHYVAQLGGRDETVAVLVEYSESLSNLLFAVGVLHFTRHHRKELGKINGAVTCVPKKKPQFKMYIIYFSLFCNYENSAEYKITYIYNIHNLLSWTMCDRKSTTPDR